MKSNLFFRILALSLVLVLCMGSVALAEEIDIPKLEMQRVFEIPDNEAMQFVRNMRVGWNLGNTFDAIEDKWLPASRHMELESYWCGAKTTPEMIQLLKDSGFNTLRMPISWHNHVDENFQINEHWMNRVQEVVDYAISRDMYVIINIHHDNDPKFYYPDEEHFEQSSRYINAIWSQVAARFADYDNHLIFESINEPRLSGTSLEWRVDKNDPKSVEAMGCISKLNQVFVDTVRAAGGNNADRFLMVPGYSASPEGAMNEYNVLPTDTVENRIIVSVHAYTPYDFALNGAGTGEFEINSTFSRQIPLFLNNLYEHYVAKGIPVVVGEFGARDKGGNLQARVHFASYYVFHATNRGIICCWWDNHGFQGDGELFGLMDRKTATWKYPEIVEAMLLNAPAID